MKHCIDPKVDFVFKALLGAEDNRDLLVHFLNAILADELPNPITQVSILNPYNEKEFLDDKLSIVDVKARDENERLYQIEIQLIYYTSLPHRIIYTWADIYSQQLKQGNDYTQLHPTYAIWLLASNAIKQDDRYLHAYKLRDTQGHVLGEHGGIWLVELEKFNTTSVTSELERWLQFLKTGNLLNDDNGLPDWMNTQEMRQAMKTLRQFSEKEKNYFAYQARQDFIRQQNTIQIEFEQAVIAKQQALVEKAEALHRENDALHRENEALQREQTAIARIKELEALLAQKTTN